MHAIVQIRLGSSRLPNKVLKIIKNKTIIEILHQRLKKSKFIEKIIFSIPSNISNKKLENFLKQKKYTYYKGSEKNVLKRYYDTAKNFNSKNIIRITGDCPLIDPYLVDKVCELYSKNNFDYVSNTINPTFPDGQDIEIFNFKSLKYAYENAHLLSDLEHVTSFLIRNNKISKFSFEDCNNNSKIRVTLDFYEDYETIKNIINEYSNKFIYYEDIVKLYKKKPNIFLNKNILRNEFQFTNNGQKLWSRANQIIAGGNMFFSKNPNLYLPDHWPTYYQKAKGCEIWDLDGQRLIDISMMGVGTNILGYCNKKIDTEVTKAIKKSNMSTLNSPEEIYLAEQMLRINPWANKVKFARTEGEANAISIRLARAASKKDKIAICGYHGWHDWYLAANLKDDKKLDNLLIKGLLIEGVPKKLNNLVYPFKYNDLDGLMNILKYNEIGAIKMEVMRNEPPNKNFLEEIREICDDRNIVLIFDECTSGFRETFGGIHKKFDISPDMAIYGKSLGNGYPITAIVGKNKIMESINKTFISSTFWTDKIGSVAALATLEEMESIKSWEYISKLGKKVKKRLLNLTKKCELNIHLYGLDSLIGFKFDQDKHLIFKTYLTQELLKKKYLFSNSFYISTAHNLEIYERFFVEFEKILLRMKEYDESNKLFSKLDSEISQDSFSRMN